MLLRRPNSLIISCYMKIVAIVGMPGAGKSLVARLFIEKGFTRIRFGDLTDREIKSRGLPPGEQSERAVREALRQEHGMAAYARLNKPVIDAVLEQGNVVIDGLYSWDEYRFLKEAYNDTFSVVAVWSSPATRYARLAGRAERPLSRDEAVSRDHAEIENLAKGGPIAMADYTIVNEAPPDNLRRQVNNIVRRLANGTS